MNLPEVLSPVAEVALTPLTNDSRALRRAAWSAAGVLLLLVISGVYRAASNAAQTDALAQRTAADAIRSVSTVAVKPGDAARSLLLPGTLRGNVEASLYARSNGYVAARYKNIGDKVSKGELLAVIEVPELDQELNQARAARDQIGARLGLAESSLARWESLRTRDAVSQQEVDERRSSAQQARADLAAAEANIKRLEQIEGFRKIVAPFSGTVIRRNVDVGTLVSAGNTGASRELFAIAQTDLLRLNVAVPQAYAAAIHTGLEISFTLSERPNAPVRGTVARTAGAIDPATRSMQIEISVPNNDGKLLPGAYTEVSLELANAAESLVIPPNTLIFGQDGPRVAVVDKEDRIAIKPVKLGRDFGKSVEVLAGLAPKEAVVLNPPDTLTQGEQVKLLLPLLKAKDKP